jgi:acyl-CoA synthetase (AMP-forming)/AMP-acid ligase II/thioesterase domain-containing protein
MESEPCHIVAQRKVRQTNPHTPRGPQSSSCRPRVRRSISPDLTWCDTRQGERRFTMGGMATVAGLSRSELSQIAIEAPGRVPLTHARLSEHIETTGDRLRSLGVGRGNRVVSVVPAGPEAASAILAISSTATFVPLDPNATRSEYELLFRTLEPTIVLIEAGVAHPAADASCITRIPVLEVHREKEAGAFTLFGRTGYAPVPATDLITPDDYAYILSTSGTTGSPKFAPVPHRSVCATVASITDALKVESTDACLVFTPLFHSLGLVSGVLVPLSAGSRSIFLAGFDVQQFFRCLEEYRPTWFSAVPTLLRTMLEQAPAYGQVIERSPLRFIRSGGSPLAPELAEKIEDAFRAPVLQVYGLSEAPALACNALDGNIGKRGSVGRVMRNEVAIFDEDDRPLPLGSSGEIVVRGPSVIREYFRNEGATRRAIRNGWFYTGDVGNLDQDGYLFVTGRRSEFINRGGEKIAPAEVDEILLSHPAVAEALTFPVPDEEVGEEIGAVIELRPAARASAADIQTFVATHLSGYKVPRRIFFVDAIPKGPTGKLKRLNMFEQLTALNIEAAHPSTDKALDYREEILADLFAKALGVDSVNRDDNFFDLGGGSLAATQCAADIGRAFGLENFSAVTFLWAPTVAAIAKALPKLDSSGGATVFTVQPEGDYIPIFLVAPGREALTLAKNLGKRPIFGIAVPNLERRSAPCTMEAIAEECAVALRRHRPSGPYALAGWCGAGVLALEIAHILTRQGAEVSFVALFDARNIYLPPMNRSRKALVQAVRQAQRISFFLSRVRRGGLSVAAIAFDSRTGVNPHAEAFDEAVRQYRPKAWNGRTIHIWASRRPPGKFREVDFDWTHLSPSGFEYYEIPGDHMSMLYEPKLAEILAAEIDRASRRQCES